VPNQHITITGNLVGDPEARSQGDKSLVKFTIACSNSYRNATGQWTDGETAFFDCVAWGRLAQHIQESAIKGDRVVATGYMRQNRWQAEDGSTRTRWECTVEDLGLSLRWRSLQALVRGPEPESSEPTTVGA
jgi:single-strand DNA-binding protein